MLYLMCIDQKLINPIISAASGIFRRNELSIYKQDFSQPKAEECIINHQTK